MAVSIVRMPNAPPPHGVFELVELALANQVRRGGRVHRGFRGRQRVPVCRRAGAAAGRRRLARSRQHRVDVRLLVRRKHVDHAVDGLAGAVRMQRAHHENAHLGRGHRDAHRLEIAQLTDQNTSGSSRRAECSACAKLWLCAPISRWLIETALALVHELDADLRW